MLKQVTGRLHRNLIFNRRVDVLAKRIGALMPERARVIDVGTGDGQIAARVQQQCPASTVTGIDVFLRPDTHIPVGLFDGRVLPFEDKSADVVMFVDVLHHTDDPSILIAEAARVARQAVIIKDHLSETAFDHATLRLMDWVGNAPHGVVLPYNYAAKSQWLEWFDAAGLEVDVFDTAVPLYAFPLNILFTRNLHFVARLRPKPERPETLPR